jgi:hypothetical protein
MTILQWYDKDTVDAKLTSIGVEINAMAAPYSVLANNSTDNTTAMNAAALACSQAGGGVVRLGPGVILTGQVTLYSNVLFEGVGRATVVKLLPGANTDLFKTYQFDSLVGGSANGPSGFGWRHLTLDANGDNQTATSLCARIYGYNHIVDDVWFVNGRGGGVYSDWGGSDNPMESSWTNYKVYNYSQPGAVGLDWRGPHDGVHTNGIVATLHSSIKAVDAAFGATPVSTDGGSTFGTTLPAAATPFTLVTTAAASTTLFPSGGGTFVVPCQTGLVTWLTVTYTSAATVGSVTTFTGCTTLYGAVDVISSTGITQPSYGIRVHGNGFGAVFNAVHVWGRNHFAWFKEVQSFASNCEAEGGFLALVLYATSGCTWIGGSIYGTNGQAGQVNEVGIQMGIPGGANASRNIVISNVFNIGNAASPNGSGYMPANSAGNNRIAISGTTANTTRYVFFYPTSDWWEVICHNRPALSVMSNPYASSPLRWVPRTGAYSAQPGEAVKCDTTGGTFAVTLNPSNSGVNGAIRVKWAAGTAAPTVTPLTGRVMDPTWAGFVNPGDSFDFSDDGSTWNLV